jgi:hypothetical protein
MRNCIVKKFNSRRRGAGILILLLPVVFLFLPVKDLSADSPLTSTPFYTHYREIPAVRKARRSKKASGKVLGFLLGPAPADKKAAVINALGWNIRGQRNASRYITALANRKRVSPADINASLMKPEELFVLGYLLAMDDYFTLKALKPGGYGIWGEGAVKILSRAAEGEPENFTYQFILALVEGQSLMKSSFCSVYRRVDSVIKRFPESKRNMKPGAVTKVMKYIKLYRKDCKEADEVRKSKFDQIYAVSSYKNWIVAGTQAGVLLRDRRSLNTIKIKPDYICTALSVWDGYLFTGSLMRIRRFDGTGWKEYLPMKRPGDGYRFLKNSRGDLIAHLKGRYWKYDPAGDGFFETDRPDSGRDVYSALYRGNGEFWSIRFLNTIYGNGRIYHLESESYPGTSPRRLSEDSRGRLWIMDFDKGFFLLNESSKSFESAGIVKGKASDLCYDPVKKRTYFLHYTRGVYIQSDEGKRDFIDLKELQFMRSMHLEDNGDLIVGGWNGVMILRETGGVWKRKKLRFYR